MAVCQNLVPQVNIKIAGKWMFIPLKMVSIGIDPYPNGKCSGPHQTTTCTDFQTFKSRSLGAELQVAIGHLGQHPECLHGTK